MNSRIWIGFLTTLLAISLYWNYRSFHSPVMIQSSSSAPQSLSSPTPISASTPISTPSQTVTNTAAPLPSPISKNILTEMRQAIKDVDVDLTDSKQLKEEIRQTEAAISELTFQIQSIDRQLILATNAGNQYSDQQRQAKLDQDHDLSSRTQTLREQIQSEENKLINMRRRALDDGISIEDRQALRNQIQTEKSALLALQNQKREFDLNWSSQKLLNDVDERNYKQSLKNTSDELKAERDSENKKLSALKKVYEDLLKVGKQVHEQKQKAQSEPQ